jgi:KaiC/GvpD/RAD55 family RecA-like ATPase
MNDARIVSAAIASREAYEKLAPHITDKDLSPPGQFWWKLVGEWYARDKLSSSVDIATLGDLGKSGVSIPKTRDLVLGYLRDIPAPVSPANAAAAVLELKRHNAGLELAAAIASGDSKKQSKALQLYNELAAATSLSSKRQVKYERASSVTELFSKVGQSNRIPLAPSRLNARIGGGALPGHHIVLVGRPDIGKSTFSVNFAVGLAIKQSQRTLVVGNEDYIDVLKARAVSRATNLTAAEIEADPARAIALYQERGGEERLQFVQMFDGNAGDLRPLIEEFEPTVIVLDQIRGLASDADAEVEKLEGKGRDFRRLLLEYKLIGLSVTQAGESAEGKAWLGMSDIYGSKTGLQGTADLIIAMGADETMKSRGQRALSFPKNKLTSDPIGKEGLLVDIDTSRSALK